LRTWPVGGRRFPPAAGTTETADLVPAQGRAAAARRRRRRTAPSV